MTRRGGTAGDAFRRIFGDGENPLGWALTLYTAWGIRVRAHIFFIIFIAAMLLMSAPYSAMGLVYRATSMTLLFGIVLLHEYGHCFACRAVKGEADDILLWPLGGLASCRPPGTWRAHLVTVLGGPGVNAVLVPVLALVIVATTGGWSSIFTNPFEPSIGMTEAMETTSLPPWLMLWIWWAYYINLVLLAFNMLVPMYPMDAGRTLHAILWARLGRRRATEITLVVGLFTAGVLAVLGIVWNETLLIALAVFGGFYCWREKQMLKFMGAEDPYDLAAARMSDRELRTSSEPTRAELKREKREREHRGEVDRILAKIKDEGMGALTRGEKKTLERESAEQRGR